jgi:predicted amidohydrolase YtcJ
MRMYFFRRLLVVLPAIICLCCHTRRQADLIIFHTKIYTVDSAFSMAQAMAVKDGKVLATGSDEEIRGSYSASQVVDAGGRYVYPGFIDAHSHFVEYGQFLFAEQRGSL